MNHVYFSENYGASHCAGGCDKVCVDRKVHITLRDGWYDDDDKAPAYDAVYYGDLEPCDGSCLPTRNLPPEAEELVRKFLASDGKERGTYERKARRHPDAVDREWLSEDLCGDRDDSPEG